MEPVWGKLTLLLALAAMVAVPVVKAAPEPIVASIYNDADGDRIFDALERALGEGPQDVLVTMQPGRPIAPVASMAERLGAPVLDVFDDLGVAVLHVDDLQANLLAAWGGVRQIEGDHEGTPELATSAVNTGVRAMQDLGFTGKGVTVAIFDGGFDRYAPGLEGKFEAVHKFGYGADADKRHGTRVAKIIAGDLPGESWDGIAPGADLYGFAIGMDHAKRNTIKAIEWILDHPEADIDLINISYGIGESVDGTDAVELAFGVLWNRGIVTFSSNGNEGEGVITVPSGHPNVLGIGSLDDGKESGFSLSDFSSRGTLADGRSKPDLMAPGGWIDVATTSSGRISYSSDSGTSFASPFAAGIGALVLEADPTLDARALVDILSGSAIDWGRDGFDATFGHGQLDAAAALAQLRDVEDPERDVKHVRFDAGTFTVASHGDVRLTATGDGQGLIRIAGPEGERTLSKGTGERVAILTLAAGDYEVLAIEDVTFDITGALVIEAAEVLAVEESPAAVAASDAESTPSIGLVTLLAGLVYLARRW